MHTHRPAAHTLSHAEFVEAIQYLCETYVEHYDTIRALDLQINDQVHIPSITGHWTAETGRIVGLSYKPGLVFILLEDDTKFSALANSRIAVPMQ